jgi:hypothetical protein
MVRTMCYNLRIFRRVFCQQKNLVRVKMKTRIAKILQQTIISTFYPQAK